MQQINFLFGVHNHQPVGNFEGVLKDSYEQCYMPFLQVLKRHPGVRISLHCSGPLLEWMADNRPEYLEDISELVDKGQVELLGGAFYEPIIPSIPEQDAEGQIELMTEYLKSRFHTTPRGMWLAERVWEPALPSVIARCGLKFTIIDESHFAQAGLRADDMFGYYLTEDQGSAVAVFPIDKRLRYLVPFAMPEETISYLRQIASENQGKAVTLADDGEKFGLWPDTHKWVYSDGFLEKFFSLLEENSDWITMPTFSEYLATHPPLGRVYLPTASYEEMSEWALPTEAELQYHQVVSVLKDNNLHEQCKPFLRGGFWRNFLSKYPESNLMHKKMLHVSEKIHALAPNRPDLKRELWKGQCNCSYWHGLFGGLYLNYLRHATYRHLLEAERGVDAISHSQSSWVEVQLADFDRDGFDEVLVSTEKTNAYFSPNYGGTLFVLDYKPKCFHLTDVLARRREAYHAKIGSASTGTNPSQPVSIHEIVRSTEIGLESQIAYDRYNKFSFMDHFLHPDSDLESFSRCAYVEEGDFPDGPYALRKCVTEDKCVVVSLMRDGHLLREGNYLPVRIEKTFRVDSDAFIEAEYVLTNTGPDSVAVWFGTEFNFTLLAGDDTQRLYNFPQTDLPQERLVTVADSEGLEQIEMIDLWSKIKIALAWTSPANLWRFPVETVSQSEAGFEKTYQGSTLMPNWKLVLKPGCPERLNIQLRVSEV